MKKFFLGGMVFLTILSSCKKDDPGTQTPVDPGRKNVMVLNEGAFQAGNASLGVYNLETNAYAQRVFTANNGRPLGDVLQSAASINDELFLVVNNSGKIEVIDPENFTSTGTISGLVSPRYILQVSNSLAYVSDLYSDSLAVIDLTTKTIDHYINLSTNTEQMLKVGNKVYVGHGYKTVSGVSVIDIQTEDVKVIPTNHYPTAMQQDVNGMIWVLCGGNEFSGKMGSLDIIDPATDQVSREIILGNSSYTNHMALNGTGDSIYFLTSHVYKMSVTDNIAPGDPFINGDNRSFYGLGYNTESDELWLGDAKDFNQNGEVLIYNRAGEIQSSFTSGISPNGFYFDK